MKKAFLRILILILGLGFVCGTCGMNSAYAADSGSALEGNVIDCSDYKEEDGVVCILKIVLNIMTFGIGVLAVIGIVLAGIQYITSQGDSAKMAKAKNRIVQVVIGLIIYALMYAALYFLVPGFNADMLNGNGGGSSSSGSGNGSAVPTEGSKTTTRFSASDIQGGLSGDGTKLEYTDQGVKYSVRFTSDTEYECVKSGSDFILHIIPVKMGRTEHKITMRSKDECETAAEELTRVTPGKYIGE